jgi:hypothetical protein
VLAVVDLLPLLHLVHVSLADEDPSPPSDVVAVILDRWGRLWLDQFRLHGRTSLLALQELRVGTGSAMGSQHQFSTTTQSHLYRPIEVREKESRNVGEAISDIPAS